MTAPDPQQQIQLLTDVIGATPHPRPWALWTLPADLQQVMVERIGDFVEDYNDTYAVSEEELIWACWPRHRGLVRELAVLYCQWVTAHEGALATPELAAYWHDRWLPNFMTRVGQRWFGVRQNACSAGHHRTDWRPAGDAIAKERAGIPADMPLPYDALTDARPAGAFTPPPGT